jgi:hypothetical protein
MRSIDRSIPPVLLSRNRTRRQVLPPSVVLKMPRSSSGTPCWPNTAASTMSALTGSMRIFEMFWPSLKATCVHVFPASVDL